MLPNKLPSIINPEQICRHAPPEGTRMEGIILLGDLDNISLDLKKQPKTPVSVSLVFKVDPENYCWIQGTLTLEIERICQRCLKPMVEALKLDFAVCPVVSDVAATKLPEHYEPLMMANGEVVLKEWIAEELNLGLPLVPRHDSPCVSYDNYTESASEEEVAPNKSPFEGLKKLKE